MLLKQGGVMNKRNKISSQSTRSNTTRRKVVNSHGYNVSNFNVFDMPVRRDSTTGRLIITQTTRKPRLKKST